MAMPLFIMYRADSGYNTVFRTRYQLHGLWNLEVQFRIHKGSPINPILRQIYPIPRIGTYFFKVHIFICNPLPPHT